MMVAIWRMCVRSWVPPATRRFSAVGFVGTGSAWTDFLDFESSRDIATGGGGFRYEIARRFGLHMGLDVAWGPDEPALYVQFGNAWFRP